MKKLIYLIVIVLISSLVLAGCSLLSNVGQVPTSERSLIEISEISCDYTYATDVVGSSQGKQINGGGIQTGRADPSNATGAMNGVFYSPGFFTPLGNPEGQPVRGWIILDFGQMVGSCINVLEISPVKEYGYPLEQAEVWVTDDLSDDWDYLGMAQNNQEISIDSGGTWPAHPNVFPLDGCVRYVKIIDMTDPGQWSASSTADGFDVDAVYAGQCVVQCVPVDIKPTSCPNPLNTKSNGVIPVAILGTEDFDVNQIDPETIRLEGVAPLRWAWEDVATPFEPYTGKEDCYLDCNTLDTDGYLDLTLKFDTQELLLTMGTSAEMLELSDGELTASDLTDGQCLVLTLEGELWDGTLITGEDVVKILKKGK